MSYEQPGVLSIRFQNEIDFCEVNNVDLKNQIERILMRNQIAFSEDWGGRLFTKSEQCVIRINSMMVEKAVMLLQESEIDLSKISFCEIKPKNIQLE